MSTRVLVIGDGKMGRAVAQVAAERDCVVIGMYGPSEMASGLTPGLADVAIEFTLPKVAAANVHACIAAGIPVVSGTTGWDAGLMSLQSELKESGGTMMHAPNFSIGVQMFRRLVELAARLSSGLGPPTPDLHLIDTHHSAKLDAPSGTAKMLARVAGDALGRELPVTSVRVGSVPGTHELVIDSPFEQIRLTHEARDRRVFAEGAVAAAKWLVGKQGVFTFDDFIRDQIAER
jgi:4-hydroxy-tetrahydrodipicolinate reductase